MNGWSLKAGFTVDKFGKQLELVFTCQMHTLSVKAVEALLTLLCLTCEVFLHVVFTGRKISQRKQ